MSLLVVGLSHRSASVDLLERTALSEDGVPKLLTDIAGYSRRRRRIHFETDRIVVLPLPQ